MEYISFKRFVKSLFLVGLCINQVTCAAGKGYQVELNNALALLPQVCPGFSRKDIESLEFNNRFNNRVNDYLAHQRRLNASKQRSKAETVEETLVRIQCSDPNVKDDYLYTP